MCTVLLPPDVNPNAVNKYIIYNVFLLLWLCILIVMYRPVYSVSLCSYVYFCVNMYCTTATVC